LTGVKKTLAITTFILASFGLISSVNAGSAATVQVDLPDEVVIGEPLIIDVIFQAYDSCSAAGTVDLIVDGEIVSTVPASDDDVDGIAEIGVPYEFDDTGDHKIEAIWRAINGCLDGAPVQSGEMQTISVVESEDSALAATGLNLSNQLVAISLLGLLAGFVIRRSVAR
jgi:hypothetical protein